MDIEQAREVILSIGDRIPTDITSWRAASHAEEETGSFCHPYVSSNF